MSFEEPDYANIECEKATRSYIISHRIFGWAHKWNKKLTADKTGHRKIYNLRTANHLIDGRFHIAILDSVNTTTATTTASSTTINTYLLINGKCIAVSKISAGESYRNFSISFFDILLPIYLLSGVRIELVVDTDAIIDLYANYYDFKPESTILKNIRAYNLTGKLINSEINNGQKKLKSVPVLFMCRDYVFNIVRV